MAVSSTGAPPVIEAVVLKLIPEDVKLPPLVVIAALTFTSLSASKTRLKLSPPGEESLMVLLIMMSW